LPARGSSCSNPASTPTASACSSPSSSPTPSWTRRSGSGSRRSSTFSGNRQNPGKNPGMEAGERKLVTVLFADLVGSTVRASEEDPERVRARLDRFYEAMAEEIGAAGGTVEKF